MIEILMGIVTIQAGVIAYLTRRIRSPERPRKTMVSDIVATVNSDTIGLV